MAILTCAYGVTGSRKTSAFGEAARYMYERTGLPGRAVYTDLGNWQVIKGLAAAGIIHPFNITGEPNFLHLIHKLARGWWPTKLNEQGQPVERHLVVPKAPIEIGDAKMKLDASGIGFYIWEGLSSTSELLMKYLRDYQIPMKQEVVSKFYVKDADTNSNVAFCSNPLSHYGYVQDEVGVSLLAELSALPVERVFISAHEVAATDEDSREPVRGPALIGKAGTPKLGKNLGDMLHFEIASGAGKPEFRVYYQSHPDPKFPNISYHCKTRLPAAQVPAMEAKFKGGYFAPDKFGDFLRAYDELLDNSSAADIAWKAEIDKKREAAK